MRANGKWRQIPRKFKTNRKEKLAAILTGRGSNLGCGSGNTWRRRSCRCGRGFEPYRAQDEIFEGGDEVWRVAQSGHHAKSFDTEFLGFLASLDIDFVERLDVFGDERNGGHQHFLHSFVGQALDGGR